MRITTANAFTTSVSTLQKRAEEVSRTQDQLTSGKRVQRASDDPAAASRAERALAVSARSLADQRGLESARNAMKQTEGALGEADDVLQQARELMVSAGNASYSDQELSNLGLRLRGLRSQLLSVANRSDGVGGHLFGGQGASQPPFVDAAGGVQYVGMGGAQQVAGEELFPMTQDGAYTWLQARTGNGSFETRLVSGNSQGAWIDAGRVVDPSKLTDQPYRVQFGVVGANTTYTVTMNGGATALSNQPYVEGQAIQIDGQAFSVAGKPADGDAFELVPSASGLSIFDAMERMASELVTANRTHGARTQTVQFGLRDIDSAMSRLQTQRAQAGEVLNRADMVESRLTLRNVEAQGERSSAEDLDMVAAVSEFQSKQSGYDAALKTYAMVQRLSLFQYLNV
jgi:flagellar hook-associated protein 3 FlgL